MQRKLSEVKPATLANQLLALAKLNAGALKERWRALYQTAQTPRDGYSSGGLKPCSGRPSGL